MIASAAWSRNASLADWWRHTHSLGFARWRWSGSCSAIGGHSSSHSSGGEKNQLRDLRDGALELVRPHAASDTRFAVRGVSYIYLEVEVRRIDCRQYRAVTRERLELLGANTHHTARFARYVGRRCADTSEGRVKHLLESRSPKLTICVLGGTGFVGTVLITHLSKACHWIPAPPAQSPATIP
jgi:hypothetical protein